MHSTIMAHVCCPTEQVLHFISIHPFHAVNMILHTDELLLLIQFFGRYTMWMFVMLSMFQRYMLPPLLGSRCVRFVSSYMYIYRLESPLSLVLFSKKGSYI
jgi:hypothetical protein